MAGKTVEVDISELQKTSQYLKAFDGDLDKAVSDVSSELFRKLPARTKSEIKKVYAIPSGKLSEGLSTKRSPDSVEIVGSGRGVSLASFNSSYAGRKSPGASVKVTHARGRAVVIGSFIPKSIPQIFERQKLPSGLRVARYPIIKAWGPSVAQMLKREEVVIGVVEEADTVMADRADKLVKR